MKLGSHLPGKKMDLIPRKKRGLSWDQRKLDHNGEFECRRQNFQPGMIKPYQILGAVWFEEFFLTPITSKRILPFRSIK